MDENLNGQNGYGGQDNYGDSGSYGGGQNNYGSPGYGTEANGYGGEQPRYTYQPDTGRYEEVNPAGEMSIGQWLFTFLICIIPIVNIVMLIVWAVSNKPKDAVRRNWARAQIIWTVIMSVISVVACMILFTSIAAFFSSYSDEWQSQYGQMAVPEPGEITDDHDIADEPSVTDLDVSDADAQPGTPTAEAVPMSGAWTDMAFQFDGHEYTLPFSYSDIAANGWTFDMADYGYEDGYILNPGDETYGTIELENPNYEDVAVTVGFVNMDGKAKDITECMIYTFAYDTCSGFEQAASFPQMSVTGGLMTGMDEAGAVAIMGGCEDLYESDHYNSYSYHDDDYSKYIDFDVYDEFGITSFDLTYYQ